MPTLYYYNRESNSEYLAPVVVNIGYTNAGKSWFLNAPTGADGLMPFV